MGAELVGYHYVGPEKFDQETLSAAGSLFEAVRDGFRADDYEDQYEASEIEWAISAYASGEEFAASFASVWGGDGRDVSTRTMSISGVVFRAVFAGDQTWGDIPDGYGFSAMRAVSVIPGMIEILGIS